LAEARLQATDDFRFKAPLGNGRFLSQPTMKLLRQPKADHPMSRPPLRQGKAIDGCSKHQANDQSGNGGKGDGHGDTPSIRNSTIMLMATLRTVATNNSHTAVPDGNRVQIPTLAELGITKKQSHEQDIDHAKS